MGRKKSHKEFLEEVEPLLADEFVIESEYRGSKVNVDIRHVLCGEIFKRRPDRGFKDISCSYCNGHFKSHNQFVKEVFELVGDEYDVIGLYQNNHIPVMIKHNSNSCNYYMYQVTPASFTSTGSRCPKCSGKMKKSIDEFSDEVYHLTGEEYIVIGDYKTARIPILIRHNNPSCNFHEFYMKPNAFLGGQRCPNCRESKGERRIKDFLDEYGVKYETNFTFNGCRYKRLLPFDFAIFVDESMTLIEFDGEQHYRSSEYFGGEDKLKLVQKRDAIKDEFCKENDITLIRIPYWEFNNIEEVLMKIIEAEDVKIEREIFNTV